MIKTVLSFVLILVFCTACLRPNPPQHSGPALKIGTGSKIEVLSLSDQFSLQSIPKGWVIEGLSRSEVFAPKTTLPFAQMTFRDRERGLFIQTGPEDFILARYTRARVSVTPYLLWRWHVSEHRSNDHPVRLLIGFYGGKTETPFPREDQFLWSGAGLPPYDRLLSIGFGDSGLRRGDVRPIGQIPHYIQRGGIENTNLWRDEAADLEDLYKRAWPQDDPHKAHITFVGIMSPSNMDTAGITFSYVWLTR